MTQSSVAISSDGDNWYLLNVSPDILHQVQAFPKLAPPTDSARGTGIAGCVLTDGEIDHTSGLLFLREGTLFQMYSTPVVRQWLKEKFPVEPMLSAFRPRPWTELSMKSETTLHDVDGNNSGLTVETIDLPAHPPLYVGEWPDATGSVVALLITKSSTGKKFLYAPGVEAITPELDAAADEADAIFFDGTFWTLNEMVDLGLAERNALDMGHLPITSSPSLRGVSEANDVAISPLGHTHENIPRPSGPPPSKGDPDTAPRDASDISSRPGTDAAADSSLSNASLRGGEADAASSPINALTHSLDWFANKSAPTKVFFHINNTNPMLNAASDERRIVDEAGIRVGQDGDTFEV